MSYMGGSFNYGSYRSYSGNDVPFGIQNPNSLRDPTDTNLSIEELRHLGTFDDARMIALRFVHDDQAFAQIWNSNTIHPQTRRWLRILVQIQTINAVCNGYYRLPDRTKIELNKERMIRAAYESRLYHDTHRYDTARQSRSFAQPAIIRVVNGDCLDTVRHFKRRYPSSNPVVLNMANAQTPGGGWRNGCGAQEENLHRRTNLFQCLEDSYYELGGQRDWNYPIPEFGGIYSPNVSVFRGSESQGYPFFSHGPEYVSFIAAAAYAHPRVKMNKNQELELSDPRIIYSTMRKIDAILKIALENGHDTVILSAFGCGAFENPPKHIAKLFHEVISERYSRSFQYLIFAIIEDHNSMHGHNPNGNIRPFADVFGTRALSIHEL